MSTLTHTGSHPVLGCVDTIGAALDDVASVEPVFMTTKQKQTALVELTKLSARVESLKLRVLAAADDIAHENGARSTAAWLADTTRDHHGTVLRSARLAAAVDERYRHVGAALADGRVNLAQAHVITTALDALPGDLDPTLRAKGEQHLVEQADSSDPASYAASATGSWKPSPPTSPTRPTTNASSPRNAAPTPPPDSASKPRGDGSTDLSARIPDHVAHRLRTYLDSYTSPRRTALEQTGEVDALPVARRRGEAFCALLENLPDTGLPQHGGTATSVMITLDLDTLLHDLNETGVATTSTGDRITADQARRLACNAHIIPVVLGKNGELLDLGRTARLFSPAQRKAMAIRDRECTAHGCTIPAAWCEAHHWKKPWSKGGRTDLADGTLLCPFHHHRAHDPAWNVHHHPNGSTTFTRRQ